MVKYDSFSSNIHKLAGYISYSRGAHATTTPVSAHADELTTQPAPPLTHSDAATRATAPAPTTTGKATVPATTTVAPRRARARNCTPPAIQQFPRPLMGPAARKDGGLILHIIVAVYTFLGLAIVCDDYFVSSLDRICEELKLSPDVAGATFMAAGSSAPELATVVIGVFFAKDDIGVSGVIGSAVFNIMFVISVCALCAGATLHLNWYPMVRDCIFYSLAILMMLVSIYNESITWIESFTMLVMYGAYCVVLHYNARLERWAQTLPVPCRVQAPEEESALVSYRHLEEDRSRRPSYTSPQQSMDKQQLSFSTTNQGQSPIQQEYSTDMEKGPTPQQQELQQPTGGPPPVPPPPAAIPPTTDYYKPKDYNVPDVSPLVMPTDAGMWEKISWGVTLPIHAFCRATMPDCRKEKWRHWYPFTFLVSMVWISFYSYIMVWMITIIGSTLGIPDTVMGLTFMAAGVSVPDALSSLAVVKEGYGDMAVSNAVGSNVFDILICLGLPWFMQTAIINPGSTVNVYSKGLTYSTLSLLSTVVFLVVTTHLNGWKLDKKYGVILMVWYLLFITFASLYELNVFGYMNPPECHSDF
ncbi:probable sodium/potassium/calcium exchanger CG1090 [Schistocerca piceifrons]|uniref:probable sodium/potassium/calcium exchanger CG1090 n=1 Tax=Schistocerca piceifrons TaxID=274613 RepID=UPI001F5EC4A3|nr:probable sodium/potassium/calcium exchanger CG1090 [Schistocerca piceifrons]